MRLYFQESPIATTLSEIRQVYELVEPTEAFGLYAYATQSGLVAFDLEFGDEFWQSTQTRWLFGIDYGRTKPQVIRRMLEKQNTEIRIHDGNWLVEKTGFLPRRDYHPKTLFLSNPQSERFGVVTGSGNFSANGLGRSVEAGAAVSVDPTAGDPNFIEAGFNVANNLWNNATPAEEVIDSYEERRSVSFSRTVDRTEAVPEIHGAIEIFWIEAGYVTKNRGPNRPGTQIDLPRGMAQYFGINASNDIQPNTLMGEIRFLTPTGQPDPKSLRFGNNGMEKITLPSPEEHGFDIYDGKILVFQRTGDGFRINALEVAEFEAAFGDRLSVVRSMRRGRRYGHFE